MSITQFISFQHYLWWLICSTKMNSLPYPIGTYIRKNQITTPRLGLKNQLHTVESSSSCVESDATLLSRRESVGVSLCLGFLQVLNPLQSSASAADLPCDFTESPSGLGYCDRVVGTGPEVVKGQLIKAHYVGKLENGTVFDSSYNRGKPLTFRIGAGEVIKGWDQGILGGDGIPAMLAGGKRKLRIPPGLGYGARGAGCRGGSCIIPPDSVLLFDVEFVGKAS